MATPKPPEPTPAQEIEAIQQKAAALKERGKKLLAARIEFEQAGIKPELPVSGHSVRDLAASMLDGSALPAVRPPTPGMQLHQAIIEQQAVAFALDDLAEQANQARRLAVAEALRETADEWRAIVRRRAEAVLELRKANEEAASFRDRLRRLGKSTPSLVCDVVTGPVFGPKVVGDPIYQFLEAAIAAGILNRKEI